MRRALLISGVLTLTVGASIAIATDKTFTPDGGSNEGT